MFEISTSNIITIFTIVFCSGGTIAFLRTALKGLKDSFFEFKNDTKNDIKVLTQKIEQHNSFGLQLVEIKTNLLNLERRIDAMDK